MRKSAFRSLMADLEQRVKEEGKKNPSWLMGYLQGLGAGTLTGFQCAALVDLLLVPLEKEYAAGGSDASVLRKENETEKASETDSGDVDVTSSRIQLKRP